MIKKSRKRVTSKNSTLYLPEKEEIFGHLEKIIKSDSSITVGVSGGPDSILTASLVYQFFIEKKIDLMYLHIVHCNHKIRKESEQEEKFIKTFFAGIQIQVYTRKNTQKNDENTLRKWRYACFEKSIKQNKSAILILGHNLTDRIETTFLNLFRGSSLNGFVGMSFYEPKTKHTPYSVLRPLLGLSKPYIEYLCKKNTLPYVQDMSNFDPETSKRNYLRLKVLPLLYELSNKNTDQVNTFIESFKNVYNEIDVLISGNTTKVHSSQSINLLPIKLSMYWKTNWGYEWKVNKSELKIQDTVSLLKEIQIYSNISQKFLNELTNFLVTKNDGYKYFNETYFFVAHGKIYVINGPKLFWQNKIDQQIQIKKLGKLKFGDFEIDIKEKSQIGSILRFPKKEDVYTGKNLSKYLLNKKIPIFWRNFVPLLVKDKKVIKVIW